MASLMKSGKGKPVQAAVRDEKLVLINGLLSAVPSTEEKTVLGNIVYLLDGCGRMKLLLKKGIEREVEDAKTPNTLFRQNTATTKLMKGYTRVQGRSFPMLLRPTLDKIASLGWEFEVDPVKTENSEENMEHLLEACQIVLDAIIENCSKVPAAIQEISKMIADAVKPKFPEFTTQAIGGYFFLRYLGPAISTMPHESGMLDPALATPKNLRGLMLISKAILNLANQTKFGDKELYLKPLNSFIDKNQGSCNEFLLALAGSGPSTLSFSQSMPPKSPRRESVLEVALPELLRFLVEPQIKEKILSHLEKFNSDVSHLGNLYDIIADIEKDNKELFKSRHKGTWRITKLTTSKVSAIFYKMFHEEATLKRITDAFNHADKDKSGSIDRREWGNVCVALLNGLGFSVDERDPCISNFIDAMFEICDVNQDNRISMEEFRSYINKVATRVSIPDVFNWLLESDNEARLRMGYREADKNGDGTLDLQEIKDLVFTSDYFRDNFHTILPSNESFEDVIEAFLEWFWIICDVDEDGRITFEELKVGLEKLKSGEFSKKC